ncbi:hypothetical protein HKD37_13G036320 [Glycine soja]
MDLSYMLINKSIHTLINNDPLTSVSALVTLVKSTERYTTAYKKAWLTKQKTIENIYDIWEKSYHNLPKLLQAIEGNIVNANQTRSNSRGCHQISSSFLEFQTMLMELGCMESTKGNLIVAVAHDENKKILSIAFIVVEDMSHHKNGLCLILDRDESSKSAYLRRDSGTKPAFNYCYNNLRQEQIVNKPLIDLTRFRKKSELLGDMTTNLTKSINSVLKKTINLSISVLVKSTYQRKVNFHHVLEFDRCDTRFLVQETINPREVRPAGNFMIRLDQRSYLHIGKCLKYVQSELCNEAYWPQCHKPPIWPDQKMLRNSKGRPVSSCIHIKMDMRESNQPKRYSICHNLGHSKNKCPHHVGNSSQQH